jgi:hypothetical protein
MRMGPRAGAFGGGRYDGAVWHRGDKTTSIVADPDAPAMANTSAITIISMGRTACLLPPMWAGDLGRSPK